MKTNYMDNIIKEAFEKNGIKELYGDNIPVMFKKKFVLDEDTEISAGTLARIKYLLSDTAEEDWVSFTLEIAFPEFPTTTFRNEDTFRCVLNLDDGVITVKGMYKDVPLSELLTVADTDARAVMNEFWEKSQEYKNKEYKWSDFTTVGFITFLVLTVLSFVMWLIGISLKYVFLQPSDLFIWISGSVMIFSIISCYFFYFADDEFNKFSKAGKALYKHVAELYAEVERKDTELGEKLSKQNSGNS